MELLKSFRENFRGRLGVFYLIAARHHSDQISNLKKVEINIEIVLRSGGRQHNFLSEPMRMGEKVTSFWKRPHVAPKPHFEDVIVRRAERFSRRLVQFWHQCG